MENRLLSDRKPLSLSREFMDILNEIEEVRDHYFITGRAGTGKSTLLQLFRNTSKKKIAVLAPTGIAALNVKGQTIHSFFGFPPKMIDPKEIVRRANHRLYKKLDIIIIDEISMVRADMIDNIDRFLRINRGINEPFGGVQMIFFGDLFQLPPVIASEFEKRYFKEHYASPYFFSAKILENEVPFHMVELQEVFRQSEMHFIRLLDNIRMREFDYDDLESLNNRVVQIPEASDELHITLCGRNATANAINTNKIKAIESEDFFYNAKITGQFKANVYPTDPVLKLKEGAQVMFVKNDPQKRFVNGTIGKISYCDKDTIKVIIYDESKSEYREIEVEKLDWEIIKYKHNPENENKISTETIGVFSQFPLKLAWAITIHKSQGKTFDKVIIDLAGGAFAYGQTYVALSRCKTFNGIILKKPLRPRDIMVDPIITQYYEHKKYH